MMEGYGSYVPDWAYPHRLLEEDKYADGAPVQVWILLIVIAALSFYCQATVTEERFVPALNIIANAVGMSDDVAGATLMAAGASSPELFSSLVALFITHSALGLGTVIGSEIFNQLCICAGAVLCARGGVLKLNPAIVIRETLFYGLSIVLLLNALKDRRPDPEGGNPRIYVHLPDAAALFLLYCVYVVVMAKFDAILKLLGVGGTKEKDGKDLNGNYGAISRTAIEVPDTTTFLSVAAEPADNFVSPATQSDLDAVATASGEPSAAVGLYSAPGAANDPMASERRMQRASQRQERTRKMGEMLSGRVGESVRSVLGAVSGGASVRFFHYLADSEKPSDRHDLYDLEVNNFEERLGCFMWQRSIFYNKARFLMHAWHLRWFSFTHDTMDSVPDRRQFDLHKLIYPKFHEIEADDTRHIVRIINPEEGKRDYYLMAPSQQIYDEVVKKCQELIAVWSKEGDAEDGGDTAEAAAEEEEYGEHEDADNEESLIEFPAGEPWYVVIIYLFLFPLKLLMHISIPDVRHLSVDGESKATTTMASVAVVSCLIWLIIGSYAMVASLEALADLMDIPDAVIGVTVSAAGTSLPNYVASQCAARQGFGNMAISNAFGSNTFNILIGLGMPWTLYTIFVTKGEPYDGLQDDGITVSVMIMTVVLLAFLVLVFASGFTLYKWSAPVQLALYAAYLAYAIGSVYLGKSDD